MDIDVLLTSSVIAAVISGIVGYVSARITASVQLKKYRAEASLPILEEARKSLSESSGFRAVDLLRDQVTGGMTSDKFFEYIKNAITSFDAERKVYDRVAPYLSKDATSELNSMIKTYEKGHPLIHVAQGHSADTFDMDKWFKNAGRVAIEFRPKLVKAIEDQIRNSMK